MKNHYDRPDTSPGQPKNESQFPSTSEALTSVLENALRLHEDQPYCESALENHLRREALRQELLLAIYLNGL